jgi:uncharacterized protein YjiS (DUF1127 family)
MIEELPHGDDRGCGRRRIARPRTRRGSTSASIIPLGSWERLHRRRRNCDFQRGCPPCRASGVSPLAMIRRIVSAIRLWRARARWRQELCELSEQMLSDIGLRRVDIGYGLSSTY